VIVLIALASLANFLATELQDLTNQKLKTVNNMLWAIAIILVVLWALGLGIHIGGALIHLLLVLAVIVIGIGTWKASSAHERI
jgi:Family of unknown function (DUF5670)